MFDNKYIDDLPKKYKNRKGGIRSLSQEKLDILFAWADRAITEEFVPEEEKKLAQSVHDASNIVSACLEYVRNRKICLSPKGSERSFERALSEISLDMRDKSFLMRDLLGRKALDKYCDGWQERHNQLYQDSLAKAEEERRSIHRVKTKYQISRIDRISVFWGEEGNLTQVHGVSKITGISEGSSLMVIHADMSLTHSENAELITFIENEGECDIYILDGSRKPAITARGKLGTTPEPDFHARDFRFGIYGGIKIDNQSHDILEKVS